MSKCNERKWGARRGQAALEYVLALAGLLAVVAVLGFLVTASFGFATRANNLVANEYP